MGSPAKAGLPACSCYDADPEQRQEDGEHGGEDRPSLPRVPHHLAERVAKRGGDREDREHLDEIGDGGRVFERMRRVHVEETAAVGAELFDDDLRRRRSERDDLLGDRLAVGVFVASRNCAEA